MISTAKDRIIRRSFYFLTVVLLLLTYEFRWKGDNGDAYKYVITSDGFGYYSYLPSIFLNGNFGEEKNNLLYHVKAEDGKLVNKYTYGTALLESPFFFAACVYAKLGGYECDGFSSPFQIAISLAGLFYFLAGLYFFGKILESEYQLKSSLIAALIVTIGLGTTITFYAACLGSFSHVYSFFLINLAIYLFIKFRNTKSISFGTLFFLTVGIIFITRPINILFILFLPYFFKNVKSLIKFIKEQLFAKKLIFYFLAIFIPVFIQMILWKIQCGKFFYWSYKGEGFYFDQFHFYDFLFSYKKGLFVYCPVLFLIFIGFWIYLRNDLWKFLWSIIFFGCGVYVLSSWYCWYYADSFGMRPVIDFYGIYGIWLAAFLIWIKRISYRVMYCILLFCFIPINLIFAYQHCYWIIHPNTMTGEKFWMVFLKTGKEYHHYFGGMDDGAPYAPKGFELLASFNQNDQSNTTINFTENEFPIGFNFITDEKFCSREKIWITVNYKKRISQPDAGKEVLFVLQGTNQNDSTLYYLAIKSKEFPQEKINEWKEEKLSITINNPLQIGNKFGLYFWNRNRESLEMKDLSIQVLAPKE